MRGIAISLLLIPLSVMAQLPVTRGGTGASTAAGARTNLGVVACGGTVTYTSNQTASSADNCKQVVMNCSSACAYTLPASQPGSTWFILGLSSIGATTATVVLGGADSYNGGSAPVLTNQPIPIGADSGSATNYVGGVPYLFSVTNFTTTPAANQIGVAFTYPTVNPNTWIGNNTTSAAVPSNFGASIGTQDVTPHISAVFGGVADAYTLTLTPAVGSLQNFTVVGGEFTSSGLDNATTTPTLNVNGLGTKTITKCGGQAMVANDLINKVMLYFTYNPAASHTYELLNPQAVTCGAPQVGTVTTGQGLCLFSAQTTTAPAVIGQCTSAVGAGGACTCTSP